MQTESKLSAQDSLALISGMIHQAQGNIQRYNFFFLFWGWVIVIANIGVYTLSALEYAHPYFAWLITVPAWVFTVIKSLRFVKGNSTRTHFDKIHIWLWMAYGVTILIVMIFGSKINYQLTPLILLLTAIPTLISGIIIKFKPLVFGGTAFWIGGLISFLVGFELHPLIGAATIVCGYLIPGYMLKKKPADV